MSKNIDFYYDLGSPNSYLANKGLTGVISRTGATVRYKPVLLGGIFKATGNQAPWLTYAPVENKMAYQMMEINRFVQRHQLDKFQMNPHFPMNTLLAQRAMIAADENDEIEKYITATESMMWEEGVKIDDPEAFVHGLNAHGLDGTKLLAQTQEPDIKAKLIANTDEAVKRGAFGAPTFYIGDDMYFGKDKLLEMETVL